ncbi:MAG: MaoC/PaaZ C-terminal domain-containing protein [Candidatus Caldarchaeum sp.]|nr:MaoC/PaaZ C-terminal domain-containing protein [Candidatus Caldarchaeum sp.]
MFFEEFEIGQEFTTRERTITGSDIDLFAALTWAANPLFLSDDHAKTKGFNSRIAPGALVFSYAVGLLYQSGLFDHITALAAVDKLNFKSSTSPGDAIKAIARVVEKKETSSQQKGLVRFAVECVNVTRQTTAFTAEMLFVILRKP